FGPGNGNGDAIQRLYDSFRRLMVYLLVVRLSTSADLKRSVERASATSQFQDEQEKQILASLDHWLSEREVAALSSPPQPKPAGDAEAESPPQSYADSLLAEARQALDLVAAELTQPPKPPVDETRGRRSKKA